MSSQRRQQHGSFEDLEVVVVIGEGARRTHASGDPVPRLDRLRVADWVIRSLQDVYAYVQLVTDADELVESLASGELPMTDRTRRVCVHVDRCDDAFKQAVGSFGWGYRTVSPDSLASTGPDADDDLRDAVLSAAGDAMY